MVVDGLGEEQDFGNVYMMAKDDENYPIGHYYDMGGTTNFLLLLLLFFYFFFFF